MRVARYRTFGMALGWTLWPLLASAEEPATEAMAQVQGDFAEALELAIQPELAVQSLLVPLEVYRGTRDTLSDLSVFNAKGEPVPFALRSLRSETRAQRGELEVPVFPLRQVAAKVAGGDLSLRVRRSADGTILDVHMPGAEEPNSETFVVAYVFDASKLEHPASSLRLALDFGAESFTTRVQVDASDDLAVWHSVSDTAVLGRLNHAGQSIERSEVELVASSAKYLRLRWPDGHFPARLSKAFVSFEHTQVARERIVKELRSDPVRERKLVYEVDLGGSLPITSIAPRLPDNALVLGSVELRASEAESGETLFQGQLYRVMHDGIALSSPPIELAPRRARYVSLRVDPRTRASLDVTLAFDIRYAPDQLLFVTHGPGPYLLAFGSYKPVAPAFDADQLLAFMPEAARNALPVESAKLGVRRMLAGAAARRAPPPAPSYKLPILWAILVLGAGTLVVLALRMLKRR